MEEWDDRSNLYKCLYRSFVSRGDASVGSKALDTTREWYCEALNIYDGTRNGENVEKDAVNAIVRFLYSTLGNDSIPTQFAIPSIPDTLKDILSSKHDPTNFFDALAYLTSRCRVASKLVLPKLFEKPVFEEMALKYLDNKYGISAKSNKPDDRYEPWNELRKEKHKERDILYAKIRLFTKFEFSLIWLDGAIRRTKEIVNSLYFKLDQRRLEQLQPILSYAQSFCKESVFDGRVHLCQMIEAQCKGLLNEIEKEPTKLSVEVLYGVIETIHYKTEEMLKQVYESSEPKIELRLPLDSYAPVERGEIEVQIAVTSQVPPPEGRGLTVGWHYTRLCTPRLD